MKTSPTDCTKHKKYYQLDLSEEIKNSDINKVKEEHDHNFQQLQHITKRSKAKNPWDRRIYDKTKAQKFSNGIMRQSPKFMEINGHPRTPKGHNCYHYHHFSMPHQGQDTKILKFMRKMPTYKSKCLRIMQNSTKNSKSVE